MARQGSDDRATVTVDGIGKGYNREHERVSSHIFNLEPAVVCKDGSWAIRFEPQKMVEALQQYLSGE